MECKLNVRVGFNALTDLVYALSPAYFLRGVQISLRKKLRIFGVMGSGIILTAIAFLCIVYARAFSNVEDPTWAVVNSFIAYNIQSSLAVVIANIPALHQLITNRGDRARASKVTKYGSTGLSHAALRSLGHGAAPRREANQGSMIELERAIRQDSFSGSKSLAEVDYAGGEQVPLKDFGARPGHIGQTE
jgi:hypothetical protein